MTNMSRIIPIGSDHAGFEMKQKLVSYLQEQGHSVLDKGTYSEERADYPDYGHAVAEEVQKVKTGLGILLCGSGNGIAMSANKHKGIRAALCWNAEIATLARQHNDANILVLPARYISLEEAKKCVDGFFSAAFEGGRHAARVQKIDC
jgi:ribose 5-phosphate isomerase B